MKIKTALLTAAIATATSAFAIAQTTAPAAAPGTIITEAGPPIPGICVFDQDQLVANSMVGKSVKTRMQQIVDQTAAELTAAGNSIQNDLTALRAQVAANGEGAMATQIQAYDAKAQAYADLRNLRSQEVEKTTDDALNRIFQEASTLMEQAYLSKNCSILFDAAATAGYNKSMDITPFVVQELDKKIQSFTFNRTSLETPAGAPAAAATPATTPARPATTPAR